MNNEIKNLQHFIVKNNRGVEVTVLNTGALIGAEEGAMLQALHSRSLGGIKGHLKTLEDRGAEKFMSSFYVGYGHKSIGDLGTTTIFVENISMLAAKAIQDWALYSGQESSTRYIPFEKQLFINIGEKVEGDEILENWREFYVNNMDLVVQDLIGKYPRGEQEDEKNYLKAVQARAFDIMRSFLPAGAVTNLAWHTNLRQAADKLILLRKHSLLEVREIADVIEKTLQEAYPNSFGHKKYPETEVYNELVMSEDYYHNLESKEFKYFGVENIDLTLMNERIFTERPIKTELPKKVDMLGNLIFEFNLDFGSYRDIQRHRAILQTMPLLTMDLGFNNWYLENLPKDVKNDAEKLLKNQFQRINNLNVSDEEKQYYIPMGYNISHKISGGLASLIYMIELRSTRFVHPTLVKEVLKMANVIKKYFPKIKLHIDETPNVFDVKRGEQDIIDKKD